MKAASLQFLQNNVDPATDPYVFLMGYYAPDDGGEGEFFWDNGNTDAANGGTIVASLFPGSATGRWKRLYDNELNVKWFGAKGDGTANDVLPIQKAIAAMPLDGGHLLFPSGVYLQKSITNASGPISIAFTFNNYRNFKISGKGALIKADIANACIPENKGFYFEDCSDGLVEGLTYDGSKMERAPAGGDPDSSNRQNGFHFRACQRITVSDVRSNYCVMDGFMVEGRTSGNVAVKWCEDIRLIGCQANYGYRQGLSALNVKRLSCVRSEFSYTGTTYGTSPMAGIDLEATDGSLQQGQIDCVIDNCLFANNLGFGLAFHTATVNSRVMHSTFLNNEFFNAPDPDNLSINNDIVSNTFVNCGINSQGGGELIENNIFKCDGGRSYVLHIADPHESYQKGRSRKQIFRNNLIDNSFAALPAAGIFGVMQLVSNNAEIEGNTFTNIFNPSDESKYVFYAEVSGYSFRNNTYKVSSAFGSTLQGKFSFAAAPALIKDNIIPSNYSTVNPAFPTYKTYIPPTGNECTAEVSRLVKIEDGQVFDITLPEMGTLKVTINGSYQATNADDSKEEIFWYGLMDNVQPDNTRKLQWTSNKANRAVHFTDVYQKSDGTICITGRQPDGQKQILSVKASFLASGGRFVPVPNLTISQGYANPGTLTFKNIYSGDGAGPSSTRPGSAGTYYTGADTGAVYLDTTLGKPIWFNGSDWIDASGTVV